MSQPKLGLLLMIATIVAFARVETLTVQIREYEVPTPNSRPHDPAVAPDGSLLHRARSEQTRTAQSENGRVQGIPTEDAQFRAARLGSR
jgi:hypothetical protein